MRKLILAASVAALAFAAPGLADKGGKGNDNGGGGNDQRGGDPGGSGKHGGGQPMNQDQGNGRGNGGGKHGGGNRGEDRGEAMRLDQGRGHGNDRQDRDNGNGRGQNIRQVQVRNFEPRDRGRNHREASREWRGNDRAVARDYRSPDRLHYADRDYREGYRGDSVNCPPGLARKDNGCLPPGQAKKYLGARLSDNYADSQLPYQYRSWYRDDGDHFYRSGDGYIYRVSRNSQLVDGLIPLSGQENYYAVGDQWPGDYNFYNVPYQYRDMYADSSQYDYRYGDGAIYRVSNGSGVVDAIVALLAGDLGVGQQLPDGYDVYNVPFQYRDRYADSADNMYRYNDGYIYQVDPKTRLISAGHRRVDLIACSNVKRMRKIMRFASTILTGVAAAALASCEPSTGNNATSAAPQSEAARNAAGDKTIVDALGTDDSKFADAAKATGLDATLAGPGPYTVLVPTNAAFDKLPAGTLDTLMKPQSRARLTRVLTAHILPGAILAEDITLGDRQGQGQGDARDVRRRHADRDPRRCKDHPHRPCGRQGGYRRQR